MKRKLMKRTISALIILVAMTFLWPSNHASGQEPAGSPAGLDVILLIDNSYSMSRGYAEQGLDPTDLEELRIRAAKFLVDYLHASAQGMGMNWRVGVASFGGVLGDIIPLHLLRDETVREGIRAEEIQFTEFYDPLDFALRELRGKSFGTGNAMAVLLLTDGRPWLESGRLTGEELENYFDPDRSEDTSIAPLTRELQENGVEVFVLRIGKDPQEDRKHWTRLIPEKHYISITSVTDLADVYHRLVAELIGLTAPPGELLPAGQEVVIQVEPYLELTIFSFMKGDPASGITLINPQGTPVPPTTGGTATVHHQVHSIRNPPDGSWKAFREGTGSVRYWVDRQYPAVRVALDAPFPYASQPITMTASVIRSGVVVTDSLRLEAEVTLPDGITATQHLAPLGDGKHVGVFEDVQMKGTYTVTAKAFLAGRALTARQMPATVAILPLPVPPTYTPQPTSTPTPSPTPTASPTLTPAPAATATPTPTSGLVGPVVTPTATAMTVSGGMVMPWSGVGIVVLLIAGLAGGLAVMVLLWKRIREDFEAFKKSRKSKEEADQSERILREAEEALDKGDTLEARRLAKQVIDNAVQYGEDVLDRMAVDVGKALDIIRRATKDKGEWADILFKYFQDGSVIIQHGLAHTLKVWWAHYPNEAVESIYALLSKDGQDLLRLIGKREVSWPEGVSEVIKNNAKVVESICKSLHSLLVRKSDENLPGLLDEVARAFGAASETFAHAGDARALYRCLAQLAAHPLWPVEFPTLSRDSLPYSRNVVRLLKQGFALPSPAWEGLPQLKRLKQEVNSHAE